MAVKMYKDDKVCNADSGQVAIMKKAGWSKTPPAKKAETADATGEAGTPAKTTAVKK